MKKITFTLLVLLSLFKINAQEKGAFEIGGNIGLNISNVVGIDQNEGQVITPDPRVSFNFAASGEYYFSDRWGLKAKVIYDRKGWNETYESVDYLFALNYISTPIMANWHFGKKRNWYLNFGLYSAFLTSSELTVEDVSIDTMEDFNSFDFGLAFGIGFKFPINEKTKLFVEYDSQSGFLNVIDEPNYTSNNARDAINFGVLFTL